MADEKRKSNFAINEEPLDGDQLLESIDNLQLKDGYS